MSDWTKLINGVRYAPTCRLVFEMRSGHRVLTQYWQCVEPGLPGQPNHPGIWLPVQASGEAALPDAHDATGAP